MKNVRYLVSLHQFQRKSLFVITLGPDVEDWAGMCRTAREEDMIAGKTERINEEKMKGESDSSREKEGTSCDLEGKGWSWTLVL